MIYNVYAMRDKFTGFGNPFCDLNDDAAKRGFSYALHNGDGVTGFAPADFDLYILGSYDNQKGRFDLKDVPEMIMTGSEAFAHD